MKSLSVIGGGLAGSEAAWQAAERGIDVTLYEMRPEVSTGAHVTSWLAELVCSNSLGSNQPDRAAGLLKEELRRLGSLLMKCADATQVPAGGALAVDREAFACQVTEQLDKHSRISIVREEVKELPDGPVIIASGPLTSPDLSRSLGSFLGEEYLYFYDAIAPVVTAESINLDIAFRASRYGVGDEQVGDYINCPFTQAEYLEFVEALRAAERISLKEFEEDINTGVRAGNGRFFEGCLPVEVIAGREVKALAFGPMRPIGLRDPRIGHGSYAVVQLRQDNLAGTLYNLVGFQTNLTFHEQRRVFRMIPGLEHAEFARYGQMHRNTFISSPRVLRSSLQFRTDERVFFAGQITGAEGYVGNIATGWVAGVNAARLIDGLALLMFPETTMIGALLRYISQADPADFQPMKANFGLLPPLDVDVNGKRQRGALHSARALADLEAIRQSLRN